MNRRMLCLTLLFSLLAACTPAQPAASPAAASVTPGPAASATHTPAPSLTPTQESTITVSDESLKGLELQLWSPWTGAAASELAALVNIFNQSNEWGIRLAVTAPGGAQVLESAVRTELDTGGSPPDLTAAPVSVLRSWQNIQPAVTDLQPYLTDPKWGLAPERIADFNPLFLAQDSDEVMRLGFPAERSATLLFYNRTWAKELGFAQAPASPEEFSKQVCAANQSFRVDTNILNDSLGGWVMDTSADGLLSWLRVFDWDGLPKTSSDGYTFNNPSALAALDYLRGLSDQGCIWNGREATSYNYLANRQALITTGTLANLALQAKTNTRLQIKDEWVVIPFPGQSQPVLLAGGPSWAVLAELPERRLAAWLFIRWMQEPANQTRFTRATGGFALSQTAADQLSAHYASLPQAGQAQALLPLAQPAPAASTWNSVRPMLSDAGWEALRQYSLLTSLKLDQPKIVIPTSADILANLDATISEVLNR